MVCSFLRPRNQSSFPTDHQEAQRKVMLDEVFGEENLRNEVIWQRTNAHASIDRVGPIHDTIFYYAKSSDPQYNDVRIEYSEGYVETFVDRLIRRDADS